MDKKDLKNRALFRGMAVVAAATGAGLLLSACAAPPSPCAGYNCQGGQLYYYQPTKYPVSYPPTVTITQPQYVEQPPPPPPAPTYIRPSVVVEQEKMVIPTPSVTVDSPPLTIQAPPVVVKQPPVELLPPKVTVNHPSVTVNPPDVLVVPPDAP